LAIKTDADNLGEGLTEAVIGAAARIPVAEERIADVYCDINGERYRSEEWGFTILRTSHLFRDASQYYCPVSEWGDMGAASGALFNGIAAATLPNVCKMPGPPAPFVPAPLPNIARSSLSPKGYSKKVKFEGKAVAIRGASFASQGDVASKATGGGLLSSNTHGPVKFVAPGSLDVKVEGKSVHTLSDPVLNNGGPTGTPPNTGATLAGVLQGLLVQATTEGSNTTCSDSGGHDWQREEADGGKPMDDKINDSNASPSLGSQFEAKAAQHNKNAGDLTRSEQLSDDSEHDEKVWWKCNHCGLQREGDQLHDDPAGGNPQAVEAKANPRLGPRDARQLGRNCQAVLKGGASGLIYKVPAGPQMNWAVKHIRDIAAHFGVAVKVVRV
jgi:hypothetical protein